MLKSVGFSGDSGDDVGDEGTFIFYVRNYLENISFDKHNIYFLSNKCTIIQPINQYIIIEISL